MPKYLSEDERRRVRGVLYEHLSHENLQTSAELHQVALQWNWDDGFAPLEWIIRQPFCDRGTALLIYWLAGPRWYCQETPSNSRGVDAFDLIAEIEARYAAGFYTQQNIAFNPRNDANQRDITREYADLPQVRELPSLMFEATPGVPIGMELPLYDSFLRRLTAAERETIENQLARAINLLRNHTGWVTQTSPPLAIVKTIKAVIYEDCEQHPESSQISEAEPLLSLGWLWLEQLCRAYGWEWLVCDREGQLTTAAYSSDQAYVSHPPRVIQDQLRRCEGEDSVVALYRLLGYYTQASQLRKAFTHGWVMPNRYAKLVTES